MTDKDKLSFAPFTAKEPEVFHKQPHKDTTNPPGQVLNPEPPKKVPGTDKQFRDFLKDKKDGANVNKSGR